MSGHLSGENIGYRYDAAQPLALDAISLAIAPGKITALIGPNGSGKSTLLKALARQLAPETGRVLLDGRAIATLPSVELARQIGILFQEHAAPGDLTVEDLVRHGRYPHRRLFEGLTPEDHAAVEEAIRLADLAPLRHRSLRQLSSGQRQLAWIAMAIAQNPGHLFLDEPTTFLDLAHQFDVMDLVLRLKRELGKTLVLVLHDLNLAARYADHLFALKAGHLAASGTPDEVLTVETLRTVFGIEASIQRDSEGRLQCTPVSKAR